MKESIIRLYLRIFYGKNIRKVKYKYKEHHHDVYIYRDEELRGYTSPVNIILMSEKIFKEYSKNVQDYIFLHELGHTKVKWPLQILLYTILIPFYLLMIFSWVLIPLLILLFAIKGASWFMIIGYSLDGILLIAMLNAIVMMPNWTSEAHADIFAIRILGKKKYKKCMSEVRAKAKKRNVLSMVIHKYHYRLIYPPIKLLFWIYDRTK